MELMGLSADVARQILSDELAGYMAMRFRLTTRLRVLNRVGTDAETRKGLEDELTKLEQIVSEYDALLQDGEG